MLARVRERRSDDRRQLADAPITVAQGVKQEQPLGVGQDLADLGVEPVAVEGIGLRDHGRTVHLFARLRKLITRRGGAVCTGDGTMNRP